MRIAVFVAALLATGCLAVEPSVAAESQSKLVIKTKSSPPRAPIEEKAKDPKARQAKARHKVPPMKCGPTTPGKPSTSTC